MFILYYFIFHNGPEIPCHESLRNESTLILPQLMVKRTYVRYKIVLMYFEHPPPRKIRTNGGPTIGTAAGTPVTILQAQNPT
jgi:hypothetical protein